MKILAIDFNSLMNRSFYAIRHLSTRDGMETNALFGFTKIYQKLCNTHQPDLVVAAYDLRAPTFRHKMYDAYKGNRSPMPEELRPQMPLGREFVDLAGGTVIGIEGYEADDILGTIAKYAATHTDVNCVIATGDRDSLQLVSEKAYVCLATNQGDVLYTPEKVKEVYGLEPHQLIEVKSLMGDSSDNIPGVKGIGEKTALALISKNGSLQNILDHLDQIEATPRIKKLIAEHREEAILSRTLGEICCDVPMDFNPEILAKKECQTEALEEFLRKYELTSVLESFGFSKKEEQLTLTTPQIADCEIMENPQNLCDLVKKAGRALFLPEWNKNELSTLYIHLGERKFVQVTEKIGDVLAELLALPLPKITFDAKPVYRYAMRNQIAYTSELEDVKLQAYLLSSSEKSYSIPDLVPIYCPEIGEFPQNVRDTAALGSLYDAMNRILSEKQMDFLYQEIERPLCEVLASMEEEGFLVDESGITEFGEILDARIETIREELMELAGREFNPNSPAHLSEILFNQLGLPTGKKTKTGYSTDVEVLEKLLPYHPIVGKILEYRKLSKLSSTYVTGLKKCIQPDGRVHSTFNQTETRTGRISSSDPNVQNIPVRTELGSEMRKFFVAKEGYTLVDADYSQIELRVLAAISGDQNMMEGFAKGADIHRMTASQVFHIPFDEVPSELRSRSKAINFGIVYGISAFSLSQDIHVTVKEAKQYIEDYLHTYSGVDAYMKRTIEQAREKGYVETIFHRPRYLPDIHSKKPALRGFSERVAMNMPIQGTAADIIKLAMIHVYRRLRDEKLESKLILQVHDELLVEAKESEADYVMKLVKEEMEHAAQLSVQLSVDIHQGKDWYQAKG
ncbi:MAG: DNA polymerase I [Candidatus Merdivicinus sp.]|jgi:DNA polymerase-1